MSNLGEEGGFAHPYIAYEDDLEGGPAGRLVGGGCAAGTRRVSHGRFQLPQLEDKLVVNGSSVKTSHTSFAQFKSVMGWGGGHIKQEYPSAAL